MSIWMNVGRSVIAKMSLTYLRAVVVVDGMEAELINEDFNGLTDQKPVNKHMNNIIKSIYSQFLFCLECYDIQRDREQLSTYDLKDVYEIRGTLHKLFYL